jgi:hypothetical protein
VLQHIHIKLLIRRFASDCNSLQTPKNRLKIRRPLRSWGFAPPPGTKYKHPSDFVYPRIPLKLPKRKVPLHFKDHSLTSAHAACVISK